MPGNAAATPVLALAVALVLVGGAAIHLAYRHGGPEMTLLLVVVWCVCLGGIRQAGAWTSVTLDAGARTVATRIGFLGWGTPPPTSGFDDYRTVVVSLKRGSESEAALTSGHPLGAPEKVGASTSGAAASAASSSTVIRHRVRGSSGSVSVAECSSAALSQTTTSPTP